MTTPTTHTASHPEPGALSAATPAEVDEALADIWTRYYAVADQIATQARYRDDFRTRLAAVEAGTYRYSYSAHDRDRDVTGLARVEERIAELTRTGDAILAEGEPYEAEFARRGGWTRAYLVTNHGGHIHRTRACTTCFPTTRFAWITTLSGHDETEIVEQAGSGACTTCYPSAPADVLRRPCRIVDPAQQAERDAKAAAKAAREATAAAKAISNPDGTPLKLRLHGTIRTERTAEIEYVDAAVRHRYLSAEGSGHGAHMIPEYEADMTVLLAALAHKRGTTPEQQRTLLAGKVDKKYAREMRQLS